MLNGGFQRRNFIEHGLACPLGNILLRVSQGDALYIAFNPLLRPHTVACKTAGISGFTPHGWRHHWASWMIMSGCDLFTLMKLGGWSSLQMVQRYAAVNSDHMKSAIDKLT
ncbi:tyrosine-type recombinase/integrase [Acetobacter pasteurianus]|uniref:tyrosine-type recombinase/integrase n=1 Tax=Acetobacter pasteurianus TaxID=438 RepID=UPI0009B9BA0A